MQTVTTDVNGSVSVKLTADPSLPATIQGDILTMDPQDSAGTTYTSATTGVIGATQVYKWVCGSTAKGTSTALTKYLPGSCRG